MVDFANLIQKTTRNTKPESKPEPITIEPQKEKKTFGQSFRDFFTSVTEPISGVYRDYYDNNTQWVEKILGRQIGVLERTLSIPKKGTWLITGIATHIFNLIKPNDFRREMDKTENLFNSVIWSYEGGKQQIKMIENEYNVGRIGNDQYKQQVSTIAKLMLDEYNANAERLGLGKMKNFKEYEDSVLLLSDITTSKNIIKTARAEAKSDFLPRIFKDKTDPEVRQTIESQQEKYIANLQNIATELLYQTDDPAKGRIFNGKEMTTTALQDGVNKTMQSLNAEYNSLLEIKETFLDVMKKTPGFNPQRALDRVDAAIEKAERTHALLLKDYINNVGKTWAQNINEYTRSFEQRTGERIKDLTSDQVGMLRISDVRELRNLKNLMLLQRDFHELRDLNTPEDILDSLSKVSFWALSPIRFKDGKLDVGAGSLLTAFSLAWGTVVTPMFKNTANFINNVFNKALLGNETDFYNSNMNMLKSAMFNFDEAKDYTLTNFFRKSAEMAPDVAEFIIPISKVAWAQQLLWKWTSAANKLRSVKYAKDVKALAKGFANIDDINKSQSWIKHIDNLKDWAFNNFQKGLTHLMLDYNVINAPFESRNPKEYNGMDALFDLTFVWAEAMWYVKKYRWTQGLLHAERDIKNSVTFAEEVYKAVAFRHLPEEEATKAWTKITADATEHADAISAARAVIRLGESYDAISFIAGIEPAKYAANITNSRTMLAELNNELLKIYRERGIVDMKMLSEVEANKIASDIIEKQNVPQLYDERKKYLDEDVKPRQMVVKPDITEFDELAPVIEKLDSPYIREQQKALSMIKTKVDDINRRIADTTTTPSEKKALSKQKQWIQDRLQYYSEWKKTTQKLMLEATEPPPSDLLWWFGFKVDWTQAFKKLNTNKSWYQQWERVTNKYFKWFDGKIHEIDYAVFHRYPGKERNVDNAMRSGTPFYVIKEKRPKGKEIYHPEDFINRDLAKSPSVQLVEPEFSLKNRIFDTIDDAVNADLKNFGEVNMKKYKELMEKAVDGLFKKWRKFQKPIEFVKWRGEVVTPEQYKQFTDSPLGKAVIEKAEVLSRAPIVAGNDVDKVLKGSMFAVFDKQSYRIIDDFSTVIVWESEQVNMIFRSQLSKEVLSNPNKKLDVSNVDNAINNTNKYIDTDKKITLSKDDKEFLADLYQPIEKFDLDNFKTELNKYVGINNDPEAAVLLNQIENIGKRPKPTFIIEDATVVQVDHNYKRELKNQQQKLITDGDITNASKMDDNMKTANVTTDDQTYVNWWSLVNNNGEVTQRNVSKFVKWLLPQVTDTMPNRFIDGLKEYRMLNASRYRVGNQQLFELIPKEVSRDFVLMRDNLNKYIQWQPLDDAVKAQMETIYKTMERYILDMSELAKKTFDDYNPKLRKDAEWMMNLARDANEYESLFYFMSRTDERLYKSIVDPNNPAEVIMKYGIPNPAGLGEKQLFSRFKNSFIDLARQWTGNVGTRFLTKLFWPEAARRIWNTFRWWAYIFGTTVVNFALLPSMLFINAVGLTTDAIYKTTGRLKRDLRKANKSWMYRNSNDIYDVMKTHGILASADDFPIIPNIVSQPRDFMRYFSNPKNWKGLRKITNNMVNWWLYNAAEMGFDSAFKRQRVLETLVADRGITNKTDFESYIKTLNPAQREVFIKEVNNWATRRYVYKTGNDFDGLKKFTFGHDAHFAGKLAKTGMRAISLLSNWWMTHIRSFHDLIMTNRLNKIALQNFESGKMSLRDSKRLTQDLLNYNHDYEMLINKIFFALSVGRKMDRISDNDIEEDKYNLFENMKDIAEFAKYVYAPFAWPESASIYRIINQTIGSAILANKYEEHDLDAINNAATTFLGRVFGEMKRRFVIPWAITEAAMIKKIDPESRVPLHWIMKAFGDDSGSLLAHMRDAYKRGTAGFGYFLDRDMNYYWYTVDMPYTPNSELRMFMPEYYKFRGKFMELNTVKQLAEIQKTDKTHWDYLKFRIPIFKDVHIGKMWNTSDLDRLNHFMTNNSKIRNELQRGVLNLNKDLEAGEYVFNTLVEHAAQDFGDDGKATRKFLDTFAKQYLFKTDDGKLLPSGDMNMKENLRVQNMFKLADEDKMWVFFSEFLAADSNKEKMWYHLLAFIQAELDAQGKGEHVPWAQRLLTAALAKDMYYQLHNQEKKRLWYARNAGFLSDLNPKADQEIKYIIADMLGDSLYYTDKEARAGVMRYYTRDAALNEGREDIVRMFSPKYKDWKLQFGRVNLAYEIEREDGKKSNNYMYTNLNNLYIRSQIQAAEGLVNGERFNNAFSAMLVPRGTKWVNDPVYYQMAITMAKTLADVIEESNAPTQDKVSAKTGMFMALHKILDKVPPSVIEAIGNDVRWKNMWWLYWTFREIWELDMNIWYKSLQDAKVAKKREWTGTLMDSYDANGNYKNTYRSKDPVGRYVKDQKAYSTLRNYYRNNRENIPKTSFNNKTYGKEANYKNLYLKFTDAISQNIPWWAGRWQAPTTWFTIKWARPIKLTTPRKPATRDEWLIARARDRWLIRGTKPTGKPPAIVWTQYVERKPR